MVNPAGDAALSEHRDWRDAFHGSLAADHRLAERQDLVQRRIVCRVGGGAVLMFRQSHVFPTYMGGYLLGCLLFALYFAVINGFGPDRSVPLGRPLLECSIWIPYLIRLWRVRLTFVR